MRTTKKSLLAATAAVALLASPLGFVGVSYAQGNSGNSAGLAGDSAPGRDNGMGGHGVAAEAQSGDRGVSGLAKGRGHGGFGDDGPGVSSDRGETASSLSRLNASSASQTARSNASSNSVVGQLGAYEAEIAEGDFESAGELLASAANRPITADVVTEVNTRLGIEIGSEEDFNALLSAAIAAQAD